MITIDKKFKKDIKHIRDFNKMCNNYTDLYIRKIAERAGLTTEEEYDILWDYTVNRSDWNITFNKK
jgi:hypothetical protein